MSEMVDRVAKIVWQQIMPGNLHKDWEAQPDSVKHVPRMRARMIIATLLEPTPDVIEAGAKEWAEGGNMGDLWQVMVMAAGGMPWHRIRTMMDRGPKLQ